MTLTTAALIGTASLLLLAPRARGLEPAMAPANSAGQFTISYSNSNRTWREGVYSRSYDKISQETQTRLIQKLTTTGLAHVESLSAPCCSMTIEVEEARKHQAAPGKVGFELITKIAVQDSSGRQVYSAAYRAELRSAGFFRWTTVLDRAEKKIADIALRDDDLIRALFYSGAGSTRP